MPRVAVRVHYEGGSRDEPPDRSGLAAVATEVVAAGGAHLGERSVSAVLSAAGAREVVQHAGLDQIAFGETVASNHLERVLWLESDRMGFPAAPTVATTSRATQKALVASGEARREVPFGAAEHRVWGALFPYPHPYHAGGLASAADLQRLRVEEVSAFIQSHFVPSNASLAVVGDFDPARVRPIIERLFGGLRAGPVAVPAVAGPGAAGAPNATSERRLAYTDDVALARVTFAWVSPPAGSAADADLVVAARVLAERLRGAAPVAVGVVAEQESHALGSIFRISVTGLAGRAGAELEAAAWSVLAEVSAEALPAATVERAIMSLRAEADPVTLPLGERAALLLTGPSGSPPLGTRLLAVTPESLRRTWSEVVRAEQRLVVRVAPQVGP